MSEEGRFYLSKNYAYGKFHHSSFLAGKPVAGAGEIYIEKGIIKIVTPLPHESLRVAFYFTNFLKFSIFIKT